jgi:hypothetical protein
MIHMWGKPQEVDRDQLHGMAWQAGHQQKMEMEFSQRVVGPRVYF